MTDGVNRRRLPYLKPARPHQAVPRATKGEHKGGHGDKPIPKFRP